MPLGSAALRNREASVLFLMIESPDKSILLPSRRKPGPIDGRVRVLPSWTRHADGWVPAFAGMTEFARERSLTRMEAGYFPQPTEVIFTSFDGFR